MIELAKKKEQTEVTQKEVPEFTKEQLLKSERFKDKRDLIDALLADNEKYSLAAVEEKINNFMEGQVDK